MKSTIMIISPFILGGLVLGAIKAAEIYAKWRYRRAVEKRNAKLKRHGLTPFRGTKKLQEPLL
jgi:hypothetical protein